MVNKLLKRFMKKNCRKNNEKELKEMMLNYMSSGKVIIKVRIYSFNSWIDKKDIII